MNNALKATIPFTQFILTGEVLTPVHIGDGTTINPLEYVILGNELIRFRPEVFMRYLPLAEQKQLLDYLERAEWLGLRRWFKARFTGTKNLPPAAIVSRSTVTQSIQKSYDEKFNSLENQLELHPFIHHPLDGQPYIPGSSLKGAIRTAVIDQKASQSQRLKGNKSVQEPEFSKKALNYNDTTTDPFRAIKISDIPLQIDKMQYTTVYNVGFDEKGNLRSETGNRGIPMNVEVLPVGTPFNAELTILSELQRQYGKEVLSMNLGTDELLTACKHYYSADAIQKELNRFFRGHSAEAEVQKILKIAKNLELNQFLLRLGRYGQFEYKTARDFCCLQGKPKKEGKSRNLAESSYPLGWVRMTLKPYDESSRNSYHYFDIAALRDEQAKFQDILEANRQERERQQAEKIREIEKREADRIAEEQRLVEEAKLPPEEKALRDLQQAFENAQQTSEKQGNELSTLIDKLLKQGVEWDISYRERLADKIAEIFDTLKWWGNKKKKSEKQEKLATLRRA